MQRYPYKNITEILLHLDIHQKEEKVTQLNKGSGNSTVPRDYLIQTKICNDFFLPVYSYLIVMKITRNCHALLYY